MGDINEIARQFTTFYYGQFDQKNYAGLKDYYRAGSMLTWEGQQIAGADAIYEKLSSLPFTAVKHDIKTIDAQPSSQSAPNLLVLVTGHLTIDNEQQLPYTQVFHLISEGGSFYVQNDKFRLNLG